MATDPGAEFRILASDLIAEAGRVQARAALVVRKTVAEVERDAQHGAPVDTGFHRSSITSEFHNDGTRVSGEVGPTSSYGIFLELGTSRMAPRPHLFPAVDRHTESFYAAMTQAAEPRL